MTRGGGEAVAYFVGSGAGARRRLGLGFRCAAGSPEPEMGAGVREKPGAAMDRRREQHEQEGRGVIETLF